MSGERRESARKPLPESSGLRRVRSRILEKDRRRLALSGRPPCAERGSLALFSRGLVELDRIPVRVLDLDLLATGPHLDLVPEPGAGGPEGVNGVVEAVDV